MKWKLSFCSRAVASLATVFCAFAWGSSSAAEIRVSNGYTQQMYLSNSVGVRAFATNSPDLLWPLDTENWVLGLPVTNSYVPGSGAAPWLVVSSDGSWSVVDRQRSAMGPFWWGFTFVVGLGFMMWWPARLFQKGID